MKGSLYKLPFACARLIEGHQHEQQYRQNQRHQRHILQQASEHRLLSVKALRPENSGMNHQSFIKKSAWLFCGTRGEGVESCPLLAGLSCRRRVVLNHLAAEASLLVSAALINDHLVSISFPFRVTLST